MSFLYLIRHPRTRPDPAVPASDWRLSDEGVAQVQALVAAPFWKNMAAVYTSTQYKTTVVGDAVQAAHHVPFVQVEGLGEARRNEWVGYEAFPAAQASFFARPDQPPVEGWESANEARVRFVAAMDDILTEHALGDSIAVVTHATVLTLYVAYLRSEAPSLDWWSRLGFAEVMAVERSTLYPVTPFRAAPYNGLPLPK